MRWRDSNNRVKKDALQIIDARAWQVRKKQTGFVCLLAKLCYAFHIMTDTSVWLAACDSYDPDRVDAAVRRCLDGLGGVTAWVRPGMRVLIKPNLLMPKRPEAATTTHPAVVAAIARAFAAAGARVVIAESAGGPYNAALQHVLYKVCGLGRLAEIPGVELNMDLSSREVAVADGRALTSMPMITPAIEADFVVSVAKMKTHGFAHFTGAVKNLFGVIPGLTKAAMHARFPEPERFSDMLVDVCEQVRPGLSLVDGIVGMEGMGPSAGSPKKAGVLVASRNPYAADLACAWITGLAVARIPVLGAAHARGLVPASPEALRWLGDDRARFATYFRPALSKLPGDGMPYLPHPVRAWLHRTFSPVPVVGAGCVGCGQCAGICPARVIEMREGVAVITHTDCIKCYCCHEICPVHAIDLVPRRAARRRVARKRTAR